MRLVEVPVRKPAERRKRRRAGKWMAFVLVLLTAAASFMYMRPLPAATVKLSLPDMPADVKPTLAWPEDAKASISAEGYDFIASNTSNSTVSTASIAKVITVLCVLQKHPLKHGESGPTLTMTADDVARLQNEINRGGAHLDIVQGEMLTEYQAIQAIMLPSANNIADTLAVWAFGSMDNYLTYANAYLKSHRMPQTHVEADASGFDPETVSTTTDLVTLAKLALDQPILMEIAGQKSATFQTAGTVYNHNTKLDDGGMTGLKTGRNDGNSGSFLFTATIGQGKDTVQLAGIVADAGSLSSALDGAEALVQSAADDFPTTVYVRKGETVGTVKTAWGSTGTIVAASDASLRHWSGSKLYQAVEKEPTIDGTKKADAATLYLKADGRKSSTKLVISQPAAPPTIWWRLSHWR